MTEWSEQALQHCFDDNATRNADRIRWATNVAVQAAEIPLHFLALARAKLALLKLDPSLDPEYTGPHFLGCHGNCVDVCSCIESHGDEEPPVGWSPLQHDLDAYNADLVEEFADAFCDCPTADHQLDCELYVSDSTTTSPKKGS